MFGQLSNRESLRDVVLTTQTLDDKAYRLGFGKYVSKSTLADANNRRDYHIFEMLQLVSASLAENKPLDRLFGKPNYNIVNELNGSTEPTLF